MAKLKEVYKPTSLKESIQIRVRFSETDPLGIVWHGNYIKYFEEGREAFGRKYGISYLEIEKNGQTIQVFTSLKEGTLCLYNPNFYEQWRQKHLSSSS